MEGGDEKRFEKPETFVETIGKSGAGKEKGVKIKRGGLTDAVLERKEELPERQTFPLVESGGTKGVGKA